ncbi:MAG: hypothetical protein IKO55_18485 [Kiritimatiellae bacterium]|nr:hypothetical protein [Kiritimatiellia bacterium]
MKNYLAIAMLALAVAGCSSYSEIARWDSTTPINDGEVPVATFLTQNFSYQLLWVIPICTGLPWTEGTEEIVDEFNVKFFCDEATIDNNLKSMNHALGLTGSRRITQLETSEDDSKAWSLFLVNRHEVRTKCIILKPAAPAATAGK